MPSRRVVDLSILADDPIPEIVLIVGGLLSVFVALYGKRDDSHLDELGTLFAFILGIVMAVMAVIIAIEETVGWFSLVVIIVLALTLFLKPMKELPWAGLFGLIAGSVAVYAAYVFLPELVFGVERWIILVVIFFIVGTIVYAMFRFVQDVLTITSMVLNWKPVMMIVGVIAIVEGVLLLLNSSLGVLF